MKCLYFKRLYAIIFLFTFIGTSLKAQIPTIVGSSFWVEQTGYHNTGKGLEFTVISDYMVAVTDCEMSYTSSTQFFALQIPSTVTWSGFNFSVVRINRNAFIDTYNLRELTIPESVTEISNLAFNGLGNRLTKLTIQSTKPPKMIRDSSMDPDFVGIGNIPVYVPDKSINDYQNADGWKFCNIRGISYNDVVSINLDKYNISIARDSTVQLIATALPEYADDRSVVWSSNNENIATVDENGLVTAIGIGETVITATAHDGSGRKAQCNVTVTPKMVKQITLNAEEITLYRDCTKQLTATIYPEDADIKDVTWSSSNEWAVTVDENGLVTCLDYSYGEAVITATANDGSGVIATCKVTLKQRLASSVTLSADELSLERTSTTLLTSHIIPENADRRNLMWLSSDENVATVNSPGVFSSEGFVTAVGVGEAVITAYTVDGSKLTASCKVTVTPKLVTSVTLDESELTIEKNFTAQLTAIVAPDDADNLGLTWTSDNEEVATVDENGLVTAVGEGTATITATANDGSGVSASCVVTVTFIDGIADVETSKVTVLAANGRITVSGKEQYDTVSVYDTVDRFGLRHRRPVAVPGRKRRYRRAPQSHVHSNGKQKELQGRCAINTGNFTLLVIPFITKTSAAEFYCSAALLLRFYFKVCDIKSKRSQPFRHSKYLCIVFSKPR